MTQRLHLPHRRTSTAERREDRPGLGARVYVVQRTGAVAVALFLLLFAVLGFASGQAFFSTRGQSVLGMSSNGLLSTLSVVVAVVLLAASLRSPRSASTVMLVLGPLFLVSAFVNAIVIGTRLNWLAFEVSNVIFSVVVGLPMLLLGAYGRIGGHLPPDSPYAHPDTDDAEIVDERPSTPEEVAAEEAMREAEIAVVQHTATPEQHARVEAMAHVHHRADRRRVWMELDAAARDRARHDGTSQAPKTTLLHPRAGRRVPWRREARHRP
jgi:Domain of unknown function (DUF4383)